MLSKKVNKIILVLILIFSFLFFEFNVYGAETINAESKNPYKSLNTSELIDEIIEKEIDDIDYYSDFYLGVRIFEKNNPFFKELKYREDAINKLNNKIKKEKISKNKESLFILVNLLNEGSDYYNELYMKNSRSLIVSANIYTPNNSIVPNAYIHNEDTYNDDDKEEIHEEVMRDYPTLEEDDYIYPATTLFNCHSYAFYNNDEYSNNIWFDDPEIYIEDESYDDVEVARKGDIICYWGFNNDYKKSYIMHSAIVYNVEENNNTSSNQFNNITLISKWGKKGIYTHGVYECEYVNNIDFVYVEIYRPRINTTYNLSDTNNTINETLSIYASTVMIDKYEMYELNPSITKYYEFRSSSSSSLDVRLYDVHMQLIDFDDLNSSSSTTHFKIKLFKNEIYYLRVAYVSNTAVGTINTQIITKETIEIDYGMNTLDGEYYSYCNVDDTGMYKISLISNTNSTTFPYGSIIVYGDAYKISPIKRLSTSLYELEAVSDNNCNNLIVYLEIGKTYYIDIDLPIADYSNISLKFERIYDIEEIDLNNNECTIMNNETQVGDNFERINILNDSTVAISYDYNGSQSENIYFVLYKEEYNANTGFNEIELIFPEMMVTYGESLTWTSDIEEGIYYIGYYNKTNSTSTISITIN